MKKKWSHTSGKSDFEYHGKSHHFVNSSDQDSVIAEVDDKGTRHLAWEQPTREVDISFRMGGKVHLEGEKATGFMDWFWNYLLGRNND